MPKKWRKGKLKDCLIISPIADESTAERAKIFKRAKYLERQVAIALKSKPFGYRATLITSDKSKVWITPHMVRRLTSDPLAIAVLDGANPNCMYELGIRHAFCLPMICLIEKRAGGPSLPFNVQDVEPLEYPPIPEGGVWSKRSQNSFRRALQERARLAIKARPSGNFTDALNRISAFRFLRLIFAQKQVELESLQKDLREYRDFLLRDYEITTKKIPRQAAKRLFDLVAANNVRVTHRNDILRELASRPELLHLDKQLEPCLTFCQSITDLAEQLANVARRLKTSATTRQPTPSEVPTRGEIERLLTTILKDANRLHHEVVTLLQHSDL